MPFSESRRGRDDRHVDAVYRPGRLRNSVLRWHQSSSLWRLLYILQQWLVFYSVINITILKDHCRHIYSTALVSAGSLSKHRSDLLSPTHIWGCRLYVTNDFYQTFFSSISAILTRHDNTRTTNADLLLPASCNSFAIKRHRMTLRQAKQLHVSLWVTVDKAHNTEGGLYLGRKCLLRYTVNITGTTYGKQFEEEWLSNIS